MWESGHFGDSGSNMKTVDGEDRQVIRNKFSARLNSCCGRWSSKTLLHDAWMNISVYFFIDHRGGTFDLRGTGDSDDYVTVEAYTLKYLIDSSNWPFRWTSDKLGMTFRASLYEVSSDVNSPLWQCDPYGVNIGYTGDNGYGTVQSSSSDSSNWWDSSSSSGRKKKRKKKRKSSGDYGGNPYGNKRRMLPLEVNSDRDYNPLMFTNEYDAPKERTNGRKLLGNYWHRNAYGPYDNHYQYGDAWGNYQGSEWVNYHYPSDAQWTRNYAFDIDFRLETTLRALLDHRDQQQEIETYFSGNSMSSTSITHYFPRFDTLEFDGAAIFYRPTFEYWKERNVTAILNAIGGMDHAAFSGDDAFANPNFKTVPVDDDNGFLQKLWSSLSFEEWMFVFGAAAVALMCCCCCCLWICNKVRQNTHQQHSSFIQLE